MCELVVTQSGHLSAGAKSARFINARDAKIIPLLLIIRYSSTFDVELAMHVIGRCFDSFLS